MTTHVFIVDTNTFNAHLNYLFAGTGASEDDIDFNNSSSTGLSYGKENKLAAMTADASRIRRDDKIIFYLQQNIREGIYEGKFYGIFKAVHDWSFIDRNDGNQYLLGSNLNKSLLFRTLIAPDNVYEEGVSEWEALDSITGMTSPNQMLWSLIYRKLKGNRGNTMLTIYESERLCQQIRDKNHAAPLNINNYGLGFDIGTQKIVLSMSPRINYGGRQDQINILPRLIEKLNNNRAFEMHLQSYIIKNIGTNNNQSLDNSILGQNFDIEWIGNEVSCGVGMQRIDIAISSRIEGNRVFIPIELKAVNATPDNVRQISRYVDWIEQYYKPNRQCDILPIIIAKEFIDKNSSAYMDVVSSFTNFNSHNAHRCRRIKYVEYQLHNNNLLFSSVGY